MSSLWQKIKSSSKKSSNPPPTYPKIHPSHLKITKKASLPPLPNTPSTPTSKNPTVCEKTHNLKLGQSKSCPVTSTNPVQEHSITCAKLAFIRPLEENYIENIENVPQISFVEAGDKIEVMKYCERNLAWAIIKNNTETGLYPTSGILTLKTTSAPAKTLPFCNRSSLRNLDGSIKMHKIVENYSCSTLGSEFRVPSIALEGLSLRKYSSSSELPSVLEGTINTTLQSTNSAFQDTITSEVTLNESDSDTVSMSSDSVDSSDTSTSRLSMKSFKLKNKEIWLHEESSRAECEEKLKGLCDGAFLIRPSTHHVGDYVLCVLFEKQVNHYLIQRKFIKSLPQDSVIYGDSRSHTPLAPQHSLYEKYENVFSLDSEDFFISLDALVLHYQSDSDGICCKLSLPVTDELDTIAVTVKESIGSGEFSNVYLGSIQEKNYAIKTCKDDRWHRANLLREANTHLMLGEHPNLVKCLGIANLYKVDEYEAVPEVSLVQGFIKTNSKKASFLKNSIFKTLALFLAHHENGSLQDFLRCTSELEPIKKVDICIDVCTGLEYLVNKHRIIHRDIASRNVLVNSKHICMICDFGMAVPLSSFTKDYELNRASLTIEKEYEKNKPTIDSNKLPIRWLAPEAWQSYRFSEASDCWSFGILMWEVY